MHTEMKTGDEISLTCSASAFWFHRRARLKNVNEWMCPSELFLEFPNRNDKTCRFYLASNVVIVFKFGFK